MLQVASFIRSTGTLNAKHVRMWQDSKESQQVRKTLQTMVTHCEAATESKRVGAVPLLHLLHLLELVVYGDSSDAAITLITDMRPVVNAALDVDIPDEDGEDGKSSGDEGAGDEDDDAGVEGTDGQGQPVSWVNQLTECLLSLLADSTACVPVAVIRSAVEAVWRAFCPNVNALALNDLLQVSRWN